MGSESIAQPKAEWAIDSEAMRARGIIVLVKSNQLVKNIENKKKISWLKLDLNPFLPPKRPRFSLLAGYNIQPSSSSTNQNAALITDHQWNFTKIRQQQATLTKAKKDIFLKGNTEFFNLGLIQERPVSERYFVNWANFIRTKHVILASCRAAIY